jgi:predicted MPP superfamily phosphohydrolase
MGFAKLRLIIVSLTVLSQIYLFVRSRQAIRSWRRSAPFKSRTICLVGVAIGLLFAMNAAIVNRPVLWVDPPFAAQAVLFYLPAVWSFGSIFSALLLCFMQVAGGLGRIVVRLYGGSVRQAAPVPENPSRRRFLQAAVGGLATAPLVLSGYAAVHAGQACEVRELTLPFGHSLRVVQLTDIHAGIYMTRKQIRRYIDQVMALQPDLFVLTGDFISNSMVFFPGCVAEMARVRARYGTFAALGNHEHWYGNLSEIQGIFRQYRILLLHNAHRVIQDERGSFAVAGIDDLRSGYPDLEAALAGLDASIPKLLLSHHPEIFPEAAAYGIPITLSGHYHGGQIKLSLPGGDISPAHLLTPYPAGLYRINASHLYVSAGIGTTFTPVRNVTPEVTLLHLT